jgi:glucosamine-6-phosphate deaminase
LRALTTIPEIPWDRVIGFHLDEYLGISDRHPASFRRYLRHELIQRVPFHAFHEIDANAPDPETFCRYYADLLHAHPPQLCLLGIGENGHLAFNDPPVADFNDPKDVKIVTLDRECRQQQVNEGWFPALAEVPGQAITLTIPTIIRIPELILSVPGERKRAPVERTLNEEISTRCPATILRTHPNAHLYLDASSNLL